MAPRLPALRSPPITFAHRGARAHAPENTIAAFELALRLGATGIESDAWITCDGHVVLDHDGVSGSFPRRKSIRDLRRDDLASHIPTLEDLYAACGTEFELSLDVKDPSAGEVIIGIARAAGCVTRLWLCHPEIDLLETLRHASSEVRLVNSTRLKAMRGGPERRASDLARLSIDAVNLRQDQWTGGLTSLFHRFDRYAFGWDAQFERQLAALVDIGIDGVYSDHVDRMTEVVAAAFPT